MCILTFSDITKAMYNGKIVINPFDIRNLGPNSYDLTLSEHILYYKSRLLDYDKENETYSFKLNSNGTKIEPGMLYLGCTNEYTECKDLVPDVSGKSTLGRLGISVHQTAGWGDNGFCGHWTLEITVIHPVILRPNMKIAQIRWNTVSRILDRPYTGKYQYSVSNKPIAARTEK